MLCIIYKVALFRLEYFIKTYIMSFQILPNWCKNLGVSLFIITSLLTAGDPFMDGSSGVPLGTHHFFKDFYGTILFSILDIFPTISLLIYLLSKEKIEDDFIKLLRLEAYQITIAIFLSLAFIFYIISPDTSFGLDWFLSLFMIIFLIIFYFKKQSHS